MNGFDPDPGAGTLVRDRIGRISLVLAAVAALMGFVLGSCSDSTTRTVKFVALLDPPAIGDSVFLTGDNNELGNWNTSAVPMHRESDSVWSVTRSFRTGEKIQYKVTGGSWWTEALSKSEDVYPNLSLKVERDTVVFIRVCWWRNKMVHNLPVLTPDRFRPARPYLNLDSRWKYHGGDDSSWAGMNFNDSGWVETESDIRWTEPSQPHWSGIGWFRFHMYVDTSLWNTTLGIRIFQLGASEVYYNGKLLYSFGKVGEATSTTAPRAMSWWQPIKIEPRYEQLIAVRYANYRSADMMRLGFAPGFVISLKDLNTAFGEAGSVRESAVSQTVFTLIPLILCFIHLSLYGFMRNQRQNLYYAICMLGFAGVTYFAYERVVIFDVDRILLLTKLNGVAVAVAIFFGMMTNYEMIYLKLPKRSLIYLVAFCALVATALIGYAGRLMTALNYVFFGMTFLEIVYANSRKIEKNLHGSWVVLVGFSFMSLFIILQILIDYSVMPGLFGATQVYVYGMMGLAVSMSVFLSYNFARVNKDLQAQLVNVRQLSDQAIEHERVANRLELERRTLELESQRKSDELESARQLQLSLLPKDVPHLKGLDVAGFMTTATEVGGDYYDFFEDGGRLTVALGDATGHGLKAGNLVTATKGLLSILSSGEKVEDILVSANRAIKQMDLHMLTMCLALARVEDRELRYASAGMPPLIVYRGESQTCETVVLKAMPLGAVASFPYASRTISISSGDIVAMVSDGLIEIFDEKHEIYGIDNVMQSLRKHSGKTAKEIVEGLIEDGKKWGGNQQLVDDLTVVVLKVVQ